MRVVMHLYKSHDSDLVSLHKSGYSISKLARKVIEAYAHGERCKYLIPECKKIDLSDVPTNSKGGLRVEFNTSDEETIQLLNSIANNRRNQFCKAMVRNSFVEQPLAVFFTNPDIIRQENDFLQSQLEKGVICLPSKNRKSSKYEELTKGMKPEFRPEYYQKKEESSVKKADTKLEQTKRNAEETPDTTDNDIISAISPVIIGAVPKAPDITNDDEIDFDMTDVSGLLSSMVEEF